MGYDGHGRMMGECGWFRKRGAGHSHIKTVIDSGRPFGAPAFRNEGKMKKILMIATGGTIASQKTDSGLAPQLSSEEILRYVPQVAGICHVSAVQLFNIDSTNMEPRHWVKIAEKVEASYDEYDGFVILHGTDTMAYTASALSYLIQDSRKPIVLTGAQKPIDQDITDAKSNLVDSFLYACDARSHGVNVVFGGQAIAGTRASKVRTKSYNAFSSIDFPNKAVIRDGKVFHYITGKEAEKEPIFYHQVDTRICVLKLIPGLNGGIFQYLKENYDAVIIESFGVGGLPRYENEDFSDILKDWMDCGKIVVMTTQVPHEGSDMATYRVGFRIKEEYELIESYDMTLEAVVTKLMWILAQTKAPEEVRRLFYRPVNYDIMLR